MLDKIFSLRNTELRKYINDSILNEKKLIIGIKASIIAIVFTLPIHLISVNLAIILFLYETVLLLITLFILILGIMLTIAYIEDLYYNLLNREGLIDTDNVDIKDLRISGFKFNAIISAAFSLITSTIIYIIIILI